MTYSQYSALLLIVFYICWHLFIKHEVKMLVKKERQIITDNVKIDK